MRRGGSGDDGAGDVDNHALGFEGADVDAEGVVHQAGPSRPSSKSGPIRESAAISSRVSAAKSDKVADFEAGMRIAHRKSEVDRGHALPDQLDIG